MRGKALDDGGIDDSVHLHDHARGFAALCMAGFTINQRDTTLGEIARGDEQRLVTGLLGVCGQVVEDVVTRRK